MGAPRKQLGKKQQQKLSISPIYLLVGVILCLFLFVRFNLKFLQQQQLATASSSASSNEAQKAASAEQIITRNALQSTEEKHNVPATPIVAVTDTVKSSNVNANTKDDFDELEEESYEPITDGVQYQIIFSTGCSAFQDWQSYMLFFHAAKVLKNAKPPLSGMENTHVTRIASGCTPENEIAMKQLHRDQIQIMSPRKTNFHLHITPDFSYVHGGTKAYKYFNKPYGTKHWMEHALGYKKGEDHRHDNDIVILLDPDQIIMRPFSNDFSQKPEAWRKRKSLPIWDTITHGQPFAQQYGFHNQWYSKTNITAIAKPSELPSVLENMSKDMINENFAAGPPYIATGRDFFKIADKWSEFGVGVHLQYPFLLAGTLLSLLTWSA